MMAIVVDYTPIEAVGQLAQQAGRAEFEKTQAATREKVQLASIQQNMEMEKARFMVEAETQARQEQFEYNVALMQQKRMIDMDIEAMDYARNRQKLAQTMNMLNESDAFNDKEKEELSVQIMAKYAGLGAGLSGASFKDGSSSSFQNFVQQGTYKAMLANSLQKAVEDELITPEQAQQAAIPFGMSGMKFDTPQEQQAKVMDRAQKRLATAIADRDKLFQLRGGNVYSEGNKVKPGTDEYKLYETLQKQVDAAQQAIESARDARTKREVEEDQMNTFNDELQRSSKMQRAVDLYGTDVVFEQWLKKSQQTKAPPKTNLSKPKPEMQFGGPYR
jgi:sulfur relay (sulfurtransferase) complex TusBCD TusD component (DsrE family)